MADWQRTEYMRFRTVDREPSRRHRHGGSRGPERRQSSLQRGQRAGGYHSDGDRDTRHSRDGGTTRSRKHQLPSPPRIIEPPVSGLSKSRQRPSPPPRRFRDRAAKPTYTTVIHQYADQRETPNPMLRPPSHTPATRRSSVPNLPVPPVDHHGLSRHPSAPKPYMRHADDSPMLRPHSSPQFPLQQSEQQSRAPGDPPPYAATNASFNLNTFALADLKNHWANSTAGHRTSTASTSGVLGPETYRYDVLGKRQFRLVKILPKTMSKLKCEIITHSLDDAPEYTAISYAWGDADDKTDITLERDVFDDEGAMIRQRVKIQVTVSLHGALAALRHQERDVLVWVNSLSIDQQNKDELSRQVQLMSLIYGKATSVAIWLGPDYDDSSKASRLMEIIVDNATSDGYIRSLIADRNNRRDFAALVSLFERDYWKRLWVVQEVYVPKPEKITVYCGDSSLQWDIYRSASDVLRRHKHYIDEVFPGTQDHSEGRRKSQQQYTFAQVFTYLGPASLYDGNIRDFGQQPLLDVMRVCREKLTANPLDKVYGILGLLPNNVCRDFPVDYKLSVKELYIDVVDHILSTTRRVDVLRECIHFPLHVESAGLPSWCPDWSHLPETSAIGANYNFSASKDLLQRPVLLDRRRKLEISAIYLDTVEVHGIAVGTLTTSADYLMAFLNWRAVLLDTVKVQGQARFQLLEDFSRTLSLGQESSLTDQNRSWSTACHHVFASLIKKSSMQQLLDKELQDYAQESGLVQAAQRRHILQDCFGAHMMGRRFCITKERQYICMGSGYLGVDDVIVVPLGCATPIILRPEGRNEYRYVGDIYVHGYMHGKAIDQLDAGIRKVEKFILH